MAATTYDHIILGTGQATGTLLGRLIPTGDAIAVVEGHRVGGSCVNYGCTPTKTLVASARAMHQVRRGEELGFRTGPVEVDFARIRARMNEVRGASAHDLTEWIESTPNVTLIRGWGQFEDGHTIRVGDALLRGKRVYINTGTRAVTPPIDGLDAVPWLDTERLLDLDRLPEHLLVVGGGYIGLELAQVYRRFGAKVTLVQRDARLMPREDPDVAEVIARVLTREGIEILCDAQVTRVAQEGGTIALSAKRGSETQTLRGSHLLIAAGRRPNSDALGLGNTGIQVDERGYIVVDDHCRTDESGVFALGDVNGHGAFTHTSVNDAEIVLDHLFGGTRSLSARPMVYALFTDPPLGRVGMTEPQAVAAGHHYRVATRPMAKIGRAVEMGETEGFVKVLVDAETDLLLGAAVLGVGGDEVINMLAAVLQAKIPCRTYRHAVLVHPTVSELIPWVLDDLAEPAGR